MTDSAAEVTDVGELTPPARGFWARRSVRLRASLVVLVLACMISAMMLMLGVGMWRNDMAINAAPLRTAATVLTVSGLSTGIEFVDDKGVSQRPPAGVLYPGGLTVGQQFLVEYAASDPTLARVAGRSAINGLIMPGFVVAGTWLVAAPLRWLLRRRDRQPPIAGSTEPEMSSRRRWLPRRRVVS